MAKKNKNTAAVVVSSYSPILSVTTDSDSNNVSWIFGAVPPNNIIKWSMLNRRYTNPSGQTLTYLGSDWQIVKSVLQESWYNSGQAYVTSYDETALVPFDPIDLPTGTYEYQLRGSYGQIGNSLNDKPYISNIVTVIVS